MIQSVKIGKKQTNQGAMNFSNLLDAQQENMDLSVQRKVICILRTGYEENL